MSPRRELTEAVTQYNQEMTGIRAQEVIWATDGILKIGCNDELREELVVMKR